jgi:hypothetical protein
MLEINLESIRRNWVTVHYLTTKQRRLEMPFPESDNIQRSGNEHVIFSRDPIPQIIYPG